jgi:hypothetical protein
MQDLSEVRQSGTRELRSLTLLTVLASMVVGCTGASRVRSISPEVGPVAHYWATLEEASALVPDALDEAGHDVVESTVSDSGTAVFIGLSGMFFGSNEAARVRVKSTPQRTVAVRTVVKHRYILDPGRRNKTELRILQALDQTMGPERSAPFDGLRVEGLWGEGNERRIMGTLKSGPDGRYEVIETPGSETIPLTELTDVTAIRGSWNYGRLGLGLGALIGLIIHLSDTSCDLLFTSDPGCETGPGGNVALFLAPVIGWGIGTAFKVEIRSPLAVAPSRGNRGSRWQPDRFH